MLVGALKVKREKNIVFQIVSAAQKSSYLKFGFRKKKIIWHSQIDNQPYFFRFFSFVSFVIVQQRPVGYKHLFVLS